MRLTQRRTSQQIMFSSPGFSLIELLIATSMGLAVLSVAFMLMTRSLMNISATGLQSNSQESLFLAQFYLDTALRQALDLRLNDAASGVDLNTYAPSANSTIGYIKTYDSLSPSVREAEALAVFLREGRQSGQNGGLVSDIRQTGLYFLKPSKTEPGALYIDLGQNTDLGPDASDLFFDNLVEFKIEPGSFRQITVSPGVFQFLVGTVNIRMVARYFKAGKSSEHRWCPQTDIQARVADCAPKISFTDLPLTFRVSLANNQLSTEQITAGGTNLIDQLYFFRPTYGINF